MKNRLEDLSRFRDFLGKIDLTKYREELKDIKWVEQDLPYEILPQDSIFNYYWIERDFLPFEQWFERFWGEINSRPEMAEILKQFKKYHFDKDGNGWFKKGFKARMYRTWVSVLTQLDFCYMVEHICAEKGKELIIECNAELNVKKGIDAKINGIGFQIAKISQRKEARTAGSKKNIIPVPYVVWNLDEIKLKIQNPRTRIKSTYQNMLVFFDKYFIQLSNGFVVFKEYYLEEIINNIDDIKALEKFIKIFIMELSGL